MTATAADAATDAPVNPGDRLALLFDELSELTGQRNAIDGRIVEIVAEIDREELWGATGARSITALVAWKTGSSHGHAAAITTVAQRLEEFPRCAQGMREGRLSLDQVGVIAARAGEGSDAHYAQLAEVATVSQLRTAVKLEPRPDPGPRPDPQPAITKTSDDAFDFWRITLPHAESATFEAALQSHRDALIAEWKHDRDGNGAASDQQPPLPTAIDALLRLVETGWDGEVQRRPHGQRTTVVVHLDVEKRLGALHLGPLLDDSERQYLTCDATAEVWFERNGEVIGCGRSTRTISRRLRRALEHRHRSCAVPGCGATRGLHAQPHRPLGRRRSDRTAQPGSAVPVSPSSASPRWHHHHRAGRPTRRHRQRRRATPPRIAGPTTRHPATRGTPLPGTAGRTSRLAVVRPVPATSPADRLGRVIVHNPHHHLG